LIPRPLKKGGAGGEDLLFPEQDMKQEGFIEKNPEYFTMKSDAMILQNPRLYNSSYAGLA
jgi:hypothetical protein